MAAADYTLILNHLEKLEAKMDGLATDLQQTNISITKLEGMKFALQDLKAWKENVESIVNPEDLREMKRSLQEIKTATEDVEKVEEDIKTMKEEKKKYRKELDDLNIFKTKAKTVVLILGIGFTTAIMILGWFLS
jgi:predicted RNase H-like nuclease (RuvC/YqgF family)